MEDDKKILTVLMPKDLYEALKAKAKARPLHTISSQIRELVEKYVAEGERS